MRRCMQIRFVKKIKKKNLMFQKEMNLVCLDIIILINNHTSLEGVSWSI